MLAFAKEAASEQKAEPKEKSVAADAADAADAATADDDSAPSASSSSSSAANNNNRRRQGLRFDFSVPGVTSISVDVHKFGLSHKGTSVLLFKGSAKIDGAALRRSAFVATSDWPGGLYVSPGVAGSRSGALLAAAWASMVFVGRVRKFFFVFFCLFGEEIKNEKENVFFFLKNEIKKTKKLKKKLKKKKKTKQEGYVSAARSIFAEVDAFISGIEKASSDPADPLSELEVIRGDDGDDDGEGLPPLGPVVAFCARKRKPSSSSPSSSSSSSSSSKPPLNIYVLNDVLSEKGWHLNALQRPAALHVCFTAQHARGGARRLLAALRSAVGALRERERAREKEGNGKEKKEEEEGMAPVYGMASASPDRGLVGEFLLTFQDVLLTG